MSPFKSTRIALSIGGMTAILASICCLGPFLLVTLGFSSAWILYLLTLTEWSRPFFIVLALIALCFAYQRIWHPVSAYNPGQICVTSKNGPRQQIEARTAVIPPMDNAMRVLLKGNMYTKVHSLP